MVLVTCNRALAQGDFCLLALIFCQTHYVVCWIYNHAQYLYKRREMMQWWVGWLDEKVGYSTWTTIGIAQSLAIQCKVLCASVCPTNIYSAQETQLKQWMQSYLLESQTHCIVIMNTQKWAPPCLQSQMWRMMSKIIAIIEGIASWCIPEAFSVLFGRG